MIALVSVALAVYEAFARLLRRPTVSELSAHAEWGPFVWGWLFAVAVHFIDQRGGGNR